MISTDFSIWSGYDPELSPEELVLTLEKRGMTVCELSTEHGDALLARVGDPTDIGRQYRAYAAAHGVRFPQGHLWLGPSYATAPTPPAASWSAG